MNLPKVGLISPHEDFSKAAGDMAKKMGINLVVNQYDNASMPSVIKKWENGMAIEAVVTGESIAEQLRGQTVLPVMSVHISGNDVLTALSNARGAGRRVILAENGYLFSREDIANYAGILGMEVKFLLYRDKRDLVRELELIRDGFDAVVATTLTAVEGASEFGIPSFLVHSDRVLIKDALEKAVQISWIRRRNAKLCRSLQAILDNAYDGIIGIDERGKVAIFNHVAEKLTGLPMNKAIGQQHDYLSTLNTICHRLIGNGEAITGETIFIDGISLVVNRVPVSLGSQVGLVITFRVTDTAKRIETKSRRDSIKQGLVAQYRFCDIVGRSAMIEETIREARKYTRSDAAVLITGDSGTGKELFAQSIHNESSRRNGPFVAINCAALPETLLESELFGYEEGAFTGARKGGKQGLFAVASGGTIFLDEIGDLSSSLQARLLRVLQQKEVMPVGGQRVVPVDVRIISATNRNLQEAVEKGDFRVDLFYRLNVLHLHIPPLRMRMEDLPLLFTHFYSRLAGAESMHKVTFNEKALEELKGYLWPGNVRELEGFVERYAALGEEDPKHLTTFKNLLSKLKRNASNEVHLADKQLLLVKLGSMEDMERQIIEQAADMVEGGKGELARMLGLSRTTLWKKLKKTEKTG